MQFKGDATQSLQFSLSRFAGVASVILVFGCGGSAPNTPSCDQICAIGNGTNSVMREKAVALMRTAPTIANASRQPSEGTPITPNRARSRARFSPRAGPPTSTPRGLLFTGAGTRLRPTRRCGSWALMASRWECPPVCSG